MATTNKHVKAVIQLRRATEQEWIDVNPILREGEPALSTDKNKLKIGNGSLHWSEIPYLTGSGGSGGTSNYNDLDNKPSINGITLIGNNTTEDLGLDQTMVVSASDEPIEGYYDIDHTYAEIGRAILSGKNVSLVHWPVLYPYVGALQMQSNIWVHAFGYTVLSDGTVSLHGFVVLENNKAMLVNQQAVIPTQTSQLVNDSGFITDFTEIDPIFSASAAANITSEDIVSWNNKSDFSGSYEDLTNKPTIPVVPTNISAFNNDVGYITDYTETDPTVPSWAKAQNKPTYTANEVGALPDDTVIPSKVSDLDNDSGFITEYTETDPVFTGSAAYGITINDITDWNNKSNFSGSYNDLTDKPTIPIVPTNISAFNNDVGYITSFTETDPTVPAWAKQPTKPTYTASEVGALPEDTFIPEALGDLDNDVGYITGIVTDLGHFDMEDYDWDFWAYLEDKTESGFYKVNEDQDGFDYFFRVERTNNRIYQEWWYEEEGSLYRYCRDGYSVGENEWEWNDTTYWISHQELENNYYLKWQTYTKTEVNNLLANKVDNSTLENNYYTMDQVDEILDGFALNNMVETTWANLRSLRDNSQLVKGAWYRITDYNFVTTKLGMQSGNHQFDIVLLAISESMLSESGYACKHAGDHYFEREVTEGGIEWMYTLYVDDYGESYGDEPMDHQDDLHSSDEFCDSGVLTHPNTGDDVPVLYKTATDEYDIDDPDYDDAYFYEGVYDFDGDEYDMWSKYEQDPDSGDWVFMQQYALTPIVVEDGELVVSPIPETKLVPVNMNAWELKYCLDNDKTLFDWAETDGKGVIYYLKDEFGNECPYDFKNAMFQRYQVSTVSNAVLNGLRNMYLYQDGYYAVTRNNNSKYWYTFASSDGTTDGSLFGECTYNIINPYIYLSPKGKNIRGINNIVLQNANRNNLGHNCYDITILSSADGNIFEGSSSDICGTSFARSTFRDSARTITLYSTARSIYGVGGQNIMGQNVDGCECGIACSNINFGTFNSSLKLGSSCSSITFGQWCYSNDVQNGSTNITFGNYCSYITIGKMCGYITFTNYYRYIAIEDNVTRLTFTTTGGSTSQYVQNVKVCRGVTNKSVAPTRKLAYEQNYYATGRIETAL